MLVTRHLPGAFSWADLATTDVDRAKAFYPALFGWELTDVPAGTGTYCMASLRGKSVAAIYALGEAQRSAGVAPSWGSYATVEDTDASAARATRLGGGVVTAPFDVVDAGRMAVVSDPAGAVFMLWQPRAHIGAEIVNEPGTLCWNELYTTDLEAARRFYGELFAWSSHMLPGTDPPVVMFEHGERPAASAMRIQPGWGAVPPHWMVYFAVDDCDRIVELATELGGKVVVPPKEAGDAGRFATVADPQGAHFAVIRLAKA